MGTFLRLLAGTFYWLLYRHTIGQYLSHRRHDLKDNKNEERVIILRVPITAAADDTMMLLLYRK